MNTTVSPHQIPAPRKGSRAERASMPVAADVVREAAITYGVCTRPVPMRVTDTVTGTVAFVDVPCGSTLDSRCPTCAERARRLRMHQCREGWHLEAEPILEPQPPNAEQIGLVLERADITAAHRELLEHGDDLTAAACAESMIAVDGELNRSGVRGVVDPPVRPRRVRSTRRRQDAPDLPRCPMANTTVGRAFTGRDGTVFRPSLFLTVTLDTYGRVTGEGTPLDPDTYDYVRAARDAICFSRLLDRLVQNLRRVAGYDVQYFAAVEPQRRLAPHAHFAIRGTIPRTVLKTAVAATYHQVWWPAAKEHLYDQDHRPVWAEDSDGNGNSGFVDPNTGFSLKTWEQALDELEAEDARPRHVARFGAQTDVQGLLAGSPEADRRIGYLAKYLTKSMGEAHESPSAAQREHLDRLQAVLAVEPCSPSCPNWLRYGIQPKGARADMTPDSCRGKAHRREHLGYGGRRILVSRKWSGKTLADHRYDRRAWVLATLGTSPEDMTRDRYLWRPAGPHDPVAPLSRRLLTAIAERQRWRVAYEAAQRGEPPGPPPEHVPSSTSALTAA